MRSYRLAALLLFALLGVLAGLSAAAAGPNLSQLSDPLSVIYIGELHDGGTLTLALADPHGLGDGVLFNYKRGSSTQGRLYADGQLVPPGSAAQARVLAAIQRDLNAHFTPVQQTALESGTLTAAAHAYGERGYYAYRLLHATDRLETLSNAAHSKNAGHATALNALPQSPGRLHRDFGRRKHG